MTRFYTVALMIVVTLMLAAAAHAEGTFLQRVDMPRGGESHWTSAWLDASGWEGWVFSLPDFPIYEAGRLFPVKTGDDTLLLVGGYGSWWQKTNQAFVEPFAVYHKPLSDEWTFEACGGAYVPLNGGPWVLYTNDVSVNHDLGKVSVGIGANNWWQEGSSSTFGVGPKVKISGPAGSSLSLRYFWGLNGGVDTARVEGTINFNF